MFTYWHLIGTLSSGPVRGWSQALAEWAKPDCSTWTAVMSKDWKKIKCTGVINLFLSASLIRIVLPGWRKRKKACQQCYQQQLDSPIHDANRPNEIHTAFRLLQFAWIRFTTSQQQLLAEAANKTSNSDQNVSQGWSQTCASTQLGVNSWSDKYWRGTKKIEKLKKILILSGTVMKEKSCRAEAHHGFQPSSNRSLAACRPTYETREQQLRGPRQSETLAIIYRSCRVSAEVGSVNKEPGSSSSDALLCI